LRLVRSQTRERLGYDISATTTAQDSAAVAARVTALMKRPLSADSAAQIALLNNRRLRSTLEDVGISQAELVEASTPRNPVLHGRPRWTSPGGLPNPEFGLEAEVLDFLLIPLQKRIAAQSLVQTERRVSHDILQLAAETKAAWFMLLASEQQLSKLHDIAGVNESISDFANRVHDAGNINDLELMELQVGYQQVQADMKRGRADVETHRAKLNRLLGLNGTLRLALEELPALPSGDPSLATAEAVALAQRQDLAAAKSHVAAMQSALALKRKTRLIPGLNLGVDTEREPDGTRLTGPELRLDLPIFNWGKASIRKLEGQLRQTQAEAEALESEVRNDVAASYAAMRLAREASEYQTTTLLPQRQSILKETLLHYNAMQKSNIALLRVKDEQQRAEKEAIESLRDYWLARGELEKAAGGRLSGKASGKPTASKPAALSVDPHRQH
jgi:cobalt-zinc-cadmium efflux system outer membrane protein